eukprot:359971-Chlamydomonas_euryale.AAC.2
MPCPTPRSAARSSPPWRRSACAGGRAPCTQAALGGRQRRPPPPPWPPPGVGWDELQEVRASQEICASQEIPASQEIICIVAGVGWHPLETRSPRTAGVGWHPLETRSPRTATASCNGTWMDGWMDGPQPVSAVRTWYSLRHKPASSVMGRRASRRTPPAPSGPHPCPTRIKAADAAEVGRAHRDPLITEQQPHAAHVARRSEEHHRVEGLGPVVRTKEVEAAAGALDAAVARIWGCGRARVRVGVSEAWREDLAMVCGNGMCGNGMCGNGMCGNGTCGNGMCGNGMCRKREGRLARPNACEGRVRGV